MNDPISLDDITAAAGDWLAAQHSKEVLDGMLRRIRMLLAQAQEPSRGPDEARMFTAKANELSARYGLVVAMLPASDPSADKVCNRWVDIPGPYQIDKLALLSAIVKAFGGTAIRNSNSAARIHVFAMESTLDRAVMLWTSLLIQQANELANTPTPAGVLRQTFVKGFMGGYTSEVRRRLDETEARARKQFDEERSQTGTTGPSTELVLAGRSSLAKAARDAFYSGEKIGKGRNRTLNAAGYRGGVAAGQRADLGGTRLGRQSQGALPRP